MLPCLASQGFPYVEKIAKLPGRGCYRCWGTNTAKISAKCTYSDWSMNPIHAIFIPPLRHVNGGVKVGRVGGRLLSIGDLIPYRLPSFIGL